MELVSNSRLARASVLAAVLALAACGEDTPTAPTYGSGCEVGTLAAGQVRHSALSESSCVTPNHFFIGQRSLYESWAVHLTAGKAYLISQRHEPDGGGRDGVDPVLALWGTASNGTPVPLAASDDEGGELNAQLFFIAPVTGDYELVASNYRGEAGLGGYQVELQMCPILATLDTAGTYTLTLGGTSPCRRTNAPGSSPDTSRYSMVAIPMEPFETITIGITSGAFAALWEAFGTGFDTYGNIYQNSDDTYGRPGFTNSLTLGAQGGMATLAVGGDAESASGTFKVTLQRTPGSMAPPLAPAPWSISGLLGSARRLR